MDNENTDLGGRRPGRRGMPLALALGIALALAGGCKPVENNRLQGYVEGEFVYVASALPGTIETLAVKRGGMVKAGDALFALEHAREQAERDEAEGRLAQAKANLADARKGRRPTEIESIEAQLSLAREAAALSETEFQRQDKLWRDQRVNSQQELDRAQSIRNQDGKRVAQLESELRTARLGAREDQVAAAEAEVKAREAAVTLAEWDLAQKRQSAAKAGLVYDTLYREGEWVGAGKPAVVLLPPENIKVRVFVPEARLGGLRLGGPVKVWVDGVAASFAGKISFLSPKAEFTPPVIYSRETRSKLAFMVEVVFEPETAVKLHPGQPVEADFAR